MKRTCLGTITAQNSCLYNIKHSPKTLACAYFHAHMKNTKNKKYKHRDAPPGCNTAEMFKNFGIEKNF